MTITVIGDRQQRNCYLAQSNIFFNNPVHSCLPDTAIALASLARANYYQRMMMNLREQVIAEIETFLAHTGMAETTLGRKAMNDPAFIGRFRSDETDPRLGTVDRLRKFMREYVPPERPRFRAEARAVA